MSTATLATPVPPLLDEARLAIAGCLARYSGPTLGGGAAAPGETVVTRHV